MYRINDRNVRFVEFNASTNWSSILPTDSWLAIILTKERNESYFGEIIRKLIYNNVCFICCVGEQHNLVHDMADEEIALRNVGIESLRLRDDMIVTTSHLDLEVGVWFGIFAASNNECVIKDVVIINSAQEDTLIKETTDLLAKLIRGYIPTND